MNKPISILLIEDSPTDAMLMNENLRGVSDFTYEMDFAESLEPGFEKLIEKKFDVVILDLGLPDSNGVKTFSRVKEKAHNTPIIIVTGNDDRDVLSEALNQGADNYLIKESANGNRIAIAILSAIRNRLAS